MKSLYILLMHTNTIPSKFVKFFTRYEYSHVAISLDKNCFTTYSFGRRSLYNILNGGFCVQTKDSEFFNKFSKTMCKIYEIQVNDYQYEQVKLMISNMEQNTDEYKYDFLGIVPRFFNIPVTFKNKFVCSYFVADVLEKANIYTFDKEPCMVVPKNFENIKNTELIYTGKYLLYS